MKIKRQGRYLIGADLKGNDKQRLLQWGFDYNEVTESWTKEWDEDFLVELLQEKSVELAADIITLITPQTNWNDIKPVRLDSKREPFPHQMLGNGLLLSQKRFMLAWEMGCGKTKPVVDTSTHLISTGKADAVVIFCPKAVMGTWIRAVSEDSELPAECILGNAADRRATLHKAFKDGITYFVFNYDGLRVAGIKEMLLKMMTANTVLVLDESHYMKDVKTQRFEAIYDLIRSKGLRWVWLLTGTPISQSPEDIYGQACCINTMHFGKPTQYASFQARYVIINPNNRHHVTGYRNLDEYVKQLQCFTHRLRKEDCVDLPPLVYQTIEFDLSERLDRLYEDFTDSKGILRLSRSHQPLLEAANPLALVAKARQLVNGWVYHTPTDEESPRETIYFNTFEEFKGEVDPKLEWIVETLTSSHAPAIIWYAFKADKVNIQNALSAAGIKFTTLEKDSKRMEAIDEFMEGRVQAFLATPQAGGEGINLQRAKIVIYYNNQYSVRAREQSVARAHRVGTTHKVTVYDLVYRGTVEASILKSLQAKQELARMIVDGSDDDLQNLLHGEVWV